MRQWCDITADKPNRMLVLTMGGFYSEDDVLTLRDRLIEAVRDLGAQPNEHLTLCDIVEMAIQSQAVVQAFASLVGSPELRSRRLAFVTGATLARLQAQRLTSRDGVRFFSDQSLARKWLLSE